MYRVVIDAIPGRSLVNEYRASRSVSSHLKNEDGKACVLKVRSLHLRQSFFWNVTYREAHIRKVMGPREDVLDATGIKRTLHTTNLATLVLKQ